MSHTHRHYHAKANWLHSKKWKSWSRQRVRRAEYAREVEDGIHEFVDTALHWDRPLDYVSEDFRHAWRAREDRRHWGKRATDRTRTWTRPGALKKLLRITSGRWIFEDGA